MEQQFAERFVGPNRHYYFNKWSAVEYSRINTWNIMGFLLAPIWLAYRKMYNYCTVFLFVFVTLFFIFLIFQLQIMWIILFVLALHVIVGYFGNRMYQYFVDTQLAAIYTMSSDEKDVMRLAKRLGGINLLSAIATFFIWVALVYGVLLLFNLIPKAFTPLNLLNIIFT